MNSTQILVVEDDGIVALGLRNRLENLGYRVPLMVPYGEEAVEKAVEIQPDLVLMDIRLKGKMDGIEAAQQIRERCDIPVIYLTAYADEKTLDRAKVTQPYGYILKPIEERELHSTIEMALYKHEMERRLKENERWLGTILHSIGDAVIATDQKGCVAFMNPVAETLTGWPESDALGRDLAEIFQVVSESGQKPPETPFKTVLKSGNGSRIGGESFLIARNGVEIPIEDSTAAIRDDSEKITGAVVVFRDITERKRSEAALKQYMLELQERNEDLDTFAHTVAHNLKNLLGRVIGFAEAMQRYYTNLSPESMEEYLLLIARNGRKMGNVIDELLLLAGVRQKEVELKPLDMRAIVLAAQQRLGHLIEEYHAEIVLPGKWPAALGYGPWVEEVWMNYLSNGIKYGGRPPRLVLGAVSQPDGRVRFWVRDNGAGLTPEEQGRLFTPFTQLRQVSTEGHGLGLSIVRRIVEKLGGQVAVQSEGRPGQGSVFSFTLPVAPGGDKDR